MRRHAPKVLIAFLLLMGVALQSKPHRYTERVPVVRISAPPSWSALDVAIQDQARFYASAVSAPAPVSLPKHASRQVQGTGACGGDLPPCSVMWCESHGSLTAQNPHSSASGKWQVLDTTWRTEDSDGDGVNDSFQGYSRASDAPEDVQDARARQIYAGGAGRGQWVC